MDTTFEIDNVTYEVIKPRAKDKQEAKKYYNRAFADAIKSGAFLRSKLGEIAKEYGIWDEKQEKKLEDCREKIINLENILDRGGIELSEAKNYAIKLRDERDEMYRTLAEINDLDIHTAENIAENAEDNFLISRCIINKKTGKLYCKDYDDFLSKSEDDPIVILGTVKYSLLKNNVNENFFKNLPENEFLIKYSFANENFRLIDDQGRLVDEKGRLVNENGYLINESGEMIDEDGSIIEKFEKKPFLKDGVPITEPSG